MSIKEIRNVFPALNPHKHNKLTLLDLAELEHTTNYFAGLRIPSEVFVMRQPLIEQARVKCRQNINSLCLFDLLFYIPIHKFIHFNSVKSYFH